MGGILSIDCFFGRNFSPCFTNRGKMACPVVHNDNQSLYLHEVTTVQQGTLKYQRSVHRLAKLAKLTSCLFLQKLKQCHNQSWHGIWVGLLI